MGLTRLVARGEDKVSLKCKHESVLKVFHRHWKESGNPDMYSRHCFPYLTLFPLLPFPRSLYYFIIVCYTYFNMERSLPVLLKVDKLIGMPELFFHKRSNFNF